MTVFTLCRRGREIGGNQFRFQVRRFMAINAGRRSVRSYQWKRSLRMIEARKFCPRFGGVTSLAAAGCSIGSKLLHALVKLILVRVLVAGNARQIFPMIENYRFRRSLRIGLLFVAIFAGDSNMSSG
jgi:hypothetical protein